MIAESTKKLTKSQISDAIDSGRIFHGVVRAIGGIEETPFMDIQCDILGESVRVMLPESDDDLVRRSLTPLLDRKVAFILIERDEAGRLIGSRRAAQRQIRKDLFDKLVAQEVFEGTVIGLMPFGAYIEVEYISGLLKNADYLGAAVSMEGRLHIGDTIRVKCKSITDTGRITWEPEVRPEPLKIDCDLTPGMIVTATVTNTAVLKSGVVGVFVRIADGLDALCVQPPTLELVSGNRVAIKIQTVDVGENGVPRLHAHIVRKM